MLERHKTTQTQIKQIFDLKGEMHLLENILNYWLADVSTWNELSHFVLSYHLSYRHITLNFVQMINTLSLMISTPGSLASYLHV